MDVRVDVTLRPDVLDPEGQAIAKSLQHLGYDEVVDVRVGKVIHLTLSSKDPQEAKRRVEAMAEKILVNPVMECGRTLVDTES